MCRESGNVGTSPHPKSENCCRKGMLSSLDLYFHKGDRNPGKIYCNIGETSIFNRDFDQKFQNFLKNLRIFYIFGPNS